VAAHRVYFGRRLANLAEAEKGAESPEATRAFAKLKASLQRAQARTY
jgi:hypothetical protein